jgi:hypothetical protein
VTERILTTQTGILAAICAGVCATTVAVDIPTNPTTAIVENRILELDLVIDVRIQKKISYGEKDVYILSKGSKCCERSTQQRGIWVCVCSIHNARL